jgi:HlyD family secretion protein
MKKIFPKDILEHSLEIHRFKNMRRSKAIYFVLLLGFSMLLLIMPLVQIDIYSATTGMIRPNKERNVVTSPIDAKVVSVLVSQNSQVKTGDSIVLLDDSFITKEIASVQKKIDTTKAFIQDLTYLSWHTDFQQDSLRSNLYKSDYRRYSQKIKDLERRIAQNASHYKRQKLLYNKGVIAKTTFQKSRYELELSRNSLTFYRTQQKNFWAKELDQLHESLNELNILYLKKREEKNKFLIKANVIGSIQHFQGIETGDFIRAGSKIAEISPEAELIVECFLSPSDIGLIEKNDVVKFQIDAFPHHQWGTVNGRVLEINRDVSVIDKIPAFRVTCSLNKTVLFLNEKTLGKLRKGMTLSARFWIAKRSLLQLLSDKIADWYN